MTKLKELFENIADAIRFKDGTSELIYAENFAQKIKDIQTYEKEFHGMVERTIERLANDKISTIYPYNFADFTYLKSVDFPNVTKVGERAFSNCSGLTSIELKNAGGTIGAYAFSNCPKLISVNLPKATFLDSYAFNYCLKLASINLPNVTELGARAFVYCSSLSNIILPQATSIREYAFMTCSNLVSVNMPKVARLYTYVFQNCKSLTTLVLGNNTKLCSLSNVNAFNSTPIASGAGYIYVPQALIEDYKTATNWVTCANQFRAIEDYIDEIKEIFPDFEYEEVEA
ncbi:MAG: leucine-rich repeat domain-containing protein [Eubacterium sp.]